MRISSRAFGCRDETLRRKRCIALPLACILACKESAVTVNLTPEQQKFIADAVASGLYTSPDEVIGASLDQLEEAESWKNYAKAKIAKGLDDLAAGRTITREEFLARISARRRKEA